MYQHPKSYTETINGVSFKMIFVEGGDVWIGEGEKKQKVTVPDFYIAETPVTQELWRVVMGKDPEELAFKGLQRPVEMVSWLDIVEGTDQTNGLSFLDEINKKTKSNYQLPTEAIWQFAAQGGNLSEGYRYAGSDNLKEVGWYDFNNHHGTQPVKLKLPNELTIFDMSGNVWEWCADFGNEDVHTILQNGRNPKSLAKENNTRVVRGGSWYVIDDECHTAYRSWYSAADRYDGIGFRLARY